MKQKLDIQYLKRMVASHAISGEWRFIAENGQHQFRARTGECLNFWPSTGTIRFQNDKSGRLEHHIMGPPRRARVDRRNNPAPPEVIVTASAGTTTSLLPRRKVAKRASKGEMSRVVVESIHCAKIWGDEHGVPRSEIALLLLAWACEFIRWERAGDARYLKIRQRALDVLFPLHLSEDTETEDTPTDKQVAAFMMRYWS